MRVSEHAESRPVHTLCPPFARGARVRRTSVLVPILCLALLSFSCGEGSPGGTAGSSDGGADARDAGSEADGRSDAMVADTSCARFKFEASGVSCGATCSSFTCSCPGAFPKSIAKCAKDGCLVAADCPAVCATDLPRALECTDTYTVRARVDAGVPDSGVPLAANGSSCTVDSACASGRCAVLDARGSCVAGTPGDACSEARDCLSARCEAAVCTAWTPTRGGAVAKSSATLTELRALADGYTVAGYGHAVDFGAGPVDSGRMLFHAEFSDNGTLRSNVWVKAPNNTDALRGVRLPDGTRRLAGDFLTSWQAGTTQLTPASASFDLFVARFASSGAVDWAKRFGSTSAQTQRIEALSVDATGASYITGAGSNLDFGGGELARSPYLAKLNPDGTLAWAKSFDMDSATGQGVAVDHRNREVVWGGVNTGLDNLSIDGTQRTLSGIGIFLARFSETGQHLWSKGFESFGPSARLAVGTGGDIALAGSFRTPTSFGGTTFDDVGGEDVFVARYSPQGDHVWSRSFGGSKTDRALAVAIDGDGSVAVGGLFVGTADFGAGPVTAQGEWDGFVALFAPTGELRMLRFVQGPHVDEVRSLAFSTPGLLVGGIASGSQDFGAGALHAGGFMMVLPR